MGLSILVYVSVATRAMTKSDLLELLETARDNNRERGVTGMLLYREGMFIQALEGEEDTVARLFEKIAADPRHTNVMTVYQNRIDERSFGDWSMGFNVLNDQDLLGVEGFVGTFDASMLAGEPGHILSLLDQMRDESSKKQ